MYIIFSLLIPLVIILVIIKLARVKNPIVKVPRALHILAGLKIAVAVILIYLAGIGWVFLGSLGGGDNPSHLMFVVFSTLTIFCAVLYINNARRLLTLSAEARVWAVRLDIIFLISYLLFIVVKGRFKHLLEYPHLLVQSLYLLIPISILICSIVYLTRPNIKRMFSDIIDEKSKKQKIHPFLKGSIIFIVFMGVTIGWHLKSSYDAKIRLFKAWIYNPIPQSVKIEKYYHVGWLDPMAAYEFKISDEDFQTIAQRYKILSDCKESNDSYYKIYDNKESYFSKPLSGISDLKCYYTQGVSNCKHCDDNLYLFWDQGNKKAYFVGED